MTATYDLTTDIGKLRLKINDKDVTPASDAHFTDEELQVFLDEADDDILVAAALALESWAAEYTLLENSERLGDYSYTKKQVDNMLALAARYRESSNAEPAIAWAEMDLATVPGNEEDYV